MVLSGFSLIILFLIAFKVSYSICPHGFFTFNDTVCQPWLTCEDIKALTLGDLIGFGAVKQAYLSTWHNLPVAVVIVNNLEYLVDFHRGLDLLIRLNPNEHVAVLIGYCKESSVYITKYYSYGSLLHFEDYLDDKPLINFKMRFTLCLSYIEIIEFIHSAFETPAVMCDSNTLNKTLEQYLLKDPESLVLNDIDALTEVKSDGLVCGHKEISGNFVAPEQLWTFQGTYDDKLMLFYNEKTDIWKIPSVCQHILGNSKEGRIVRYYLFEINKECRQVDSMLRPNASKVLSSYVEVYNVVFNVKEEL